MQKVEPITPSIDLDLLDTLGQVPQIVATPPHRLTWLDNGTPVVWVNRMCTWNGAIGENVAADLDDPLTLYRCETGMYTPQPWRPFTIGKAPVIVSPDELPAMLAELRRTFEYHWRLASRYEQDRTLRHFWPGLTATQTVTDDSGAALLAKPWLFFPAGTPVATARAWLEGLS